MNIMTKQGSLDNVITYEHYCDTIADLQNIPKSQITLGSIAIVVAGENDSIEIYIADSHKQWTELTSMSGGGEIDPEAIADAVENWLNEHSEIIAPVQDVQVNGTSILDAQGVANVPIASANDLGLIKIVDSTSGLYKTSANELRIASATDAAIKAGNNDYRPVVSANQHKSTFYGLAKAAGVDEKDSALSVGQYTDEAKSAIRNMLGAGGVQDVQINGISILYDQGVASIPMAGTNGVRLGVVALANMYGLSRNASGRMYIVSASSSEIKNGEFDFKPVVPMHQHESTFYGLAKAAGDTTQSQSSNEVGTYTNEAKTAIRNMLGVETTTMFVENISGTTVTITGEPNTRYVCGEVLSISITPPQTGTIDVFFTAGSTVPVLTLPNTVVMPEWWTGVESGYTYEIVITDGVYGSVMAWPT